MPATPSQPGALRRVIWILDALQPGGAERLALRFAATAPPPWQVELVALRGGAGAPTAAIWGPELAAVAAGARQLRMRRLIDVVSWGQLLGHLRRREPALVHTHLRYATVWGAAAACWLGLPYLTTVHLGPSPEPTRRQAWAARLEASARRHAARVVYVSEAQRRAWGGQAAAEPAVVIGNGVAAPAPGLDRGSLRRQRGLPESACVMTTVAVVRARKGWRWWLEAIERVAPARPGARFVWVGGGPESELLRRAAAASRCASQIVLPGSRADVAAWLSASDVFLFPSEEEAQPTAVMEAMAAGLPIVATAITAITEVLGGTGRLVAPGDAGALAQAALAWSAPGAEGERQEWGERARRRAQACYSETAWRERLLRLYEEVLDERDPARARHSDGRVFCPGRAAAL